jgi:glycosyltransferase involved in cell wall biosynthesis
MRIMHVVRSLNPAAGGLPVVPVRLAAAQSALGHHVALVSERGLAEGEMHAALFEGVPGAGGVRIHWIPHCGQGTILVGGPAVSALKEALAGAQVIHLHGIWDPMIWLASQTAARLRIPYLVAPHGMLDPWSLAQKRWKKWLALKLGWKRILDRAAAIHCLNQDEEHLLANLRLVAPTAIIPNGVFLEESDRTPATIEAATKLPKQPYVLFLSRLHYKKGLDILADAVPIMCAKNPDLHLVVAGPDGGAESGFKNQVMQTGFADRVHVIGALHGPAKWAALRGATCFCLPSRQEGFSMAILEALASRVPVVISDACHFPEIAEVGAGVIVPLAAHEVAAAILRLAGDADLRIQMGLAGRRMVEERFTWRRVAEKAISVYTRIIESRSSHSSPAK